MKERERNIDVREKHRLVASCMCPGGDWTHNPGMGTDWDLSQQPFTLQDDAQLTKPRQSGHPMCHLKKAKER